MAFAKFMSSAAGRLVRILAGVVLIFVGLVSVGGTAGTILAIVGLVPLIAGLFNFCVFAPLFGGPFLGREVR
jgi:hypothetical protein